MRQFHTFVVILLIIGGINLGIMGIADLNLIAYLENLVWLDKIIYIAIGAAAVYFAFAWHFVRRPPRPSAR